jgi:hypothetical protein
LEIPSGREAGRRAGAGVSGALPADRAADRVVNAVALWNTRYLSAAVDHLRGQGIPVKDEDVARLSPLGHTHLNCLGRYAIASSTPAAGLRELGHIPDLPADFEGQNEW